MNDSVQVVAMLRGEATLPWEVSLSKRHKRQLGPLQGPVERLLHRDPAQRGDLASFHQACTDLFSSRILQA